MSRSIDEFDFHAEQLLRKSKTNPLRERMRRFIDDQDTGAELKQKRAEIDGKPLSETVIDGRDERL